MCMGEYADMEIEQGERDELQRSFGHGTLSTRCQFCDTMILRRNGQWIETLSNRLHNCRVATADEFPDV